MILLAQLAPTDLPFFHEPMAVVAVLLSVLGVLFALNAHPRFGRIFKIIPLLVFAYFVPTLLSNLNIIPLSNEFVHESEARIGLDLSSYQANVLLNDGTIRVAKSDSEYWFLDDVKKIARSKNWLAQRISEVVKIMQKSGLLCQAAFLHELKNPSPIKFKTSFVLYDFIKTWLLPASLILLTLAVDVLAILGLGRNAVYLFLGATTAVVLGGPLAYLLCGTVANLVGFELIPPEVGDQAWRGLAALSGSWIGGGANFVAIGETAEATESTLALMVVVDVAIANVWMAVLLWFAGREKAMDEKIGADRSSLDKVRNKVADYQAEVSRPTSLPALLTMAGLAIGGAVFATWLAPQLPEIGTMVKGFTWVVILVTAIGLALSFTPLRKLEGSGASALGSVFLYLLVTTIGAKAEFSAILDPKNTGVLIIGAVWMLFHVAILMIMRRMLKAPIFFVAVGSKANIGGAASAPIVASAFHPALAPVGVMLAIGGYVLGTYAAIVCGELLHGVHILLGN
jgi:uncharacterized membrane protein